MGAGAWSNGTKIEIRCSVFEGNRKSRKQEHQWAGPELAMAH